MPVERYWDGSQWTQIVRNATVAATHAPTPIGYGFGAPVAAKTNTSAILSLVFSCIGLLTCGLASIAGVVLGHVARSQIRSRAGEDGSGLALAGLIIGYLTIAAVVAYVVLVVAWLSSWDDLGALSLTG